MNHYHSQMPKFLLKQFDVRTSNDIVSLGSITQNHLGKFKEIENPNQGLLEAHYLNNLES